MNSRQYSQKETSEIVLYIFRACTYTRQFPFKYNGHFYLRDLLKSIHSTRLVHRGTTQSYTVDRLIEIVQIDINHKSKHSRNFLI